MLNFTAAQVSQKIEERASQPTLMTLDVTSSAAQDLAKELEQVFESEGRELRLELLQDWRIFWKLREGDSRALVAHPEEKQWVATIALSQADGSRFLEQLRSSPTLRLSEIIRLSAPSNLDLVLKIENWPPKLGRSPSNSA